MDEASAERARIYRLRAQEVRTAALDIRHPESRAALIRLAASYERLADNIDNATAVRLKELKPAEERS